MQSYLQFRRFGRAAEEEQQRKQEHARNAEKFQTRRRLAAKTRPSHPSVSSETSSEASTSSKELDTPDLEQGNSIPGQSLATDSLPLGCHVAMRYQLEQTDDMEDLAINHSTSRASTANNTLSPRSTKPDMSATRTRTQQSTGTALGQAMTGVDVRPRTTHEGGKGDLVFVVEYQGADDPSNPHNWGFGIRIFCTMLIASIGFVVGLASAIDSSALPYAAKEFGVSEVTESLATGMIYIFDSQPYCTDQS